MSKYFLQVLDTDGNPNTEFELIPIEDNDENTIKEAIESFVEEDSDNDYSAAYEMDYGKEYNSTEIEQTENGHYDARAETDFTNYYDYKFKVIEIPD